MILSACNHCYNFDDSYNTMIQRVEIWFLIKSHRRWIVRIHLQQSHPIGRGSLQIHPANLTRCESHAFEKHSSFGFESKNIRKISNFHRQFSSSTAGEYSRWGRDDAENQNHRFRFLQGNKWQTDFGITGHTWICRWVLIRLRLPIQNEGTWVVLSILMMRNGRCYWRFYCSYS